MAFYEYKVIPAPSKGRKARGVKRPEARFAFGLQEVMNEAAAEGWEYLRADILPSEERQGLTSTHTVYRSVLVFRRPRTDANAAAEPGVDAADTQVDAGGNGRGEDARQNGSEDQPHFSTDRDDDTSNLDHVPQEETAGSDGNDAGTDDPRHPG